MNSKQLTLLTLSVCIGALTLTGCPPKKKLDIAKEEIEEELDETEQIEDLTDADLADQNPPIEITQDWSEIPSLQSIRFDYDRASLSATQRAVLKSNVAILKKLPKKVQIRIAGHCDDRGTIEYNIALGQRRANTIRSFYRTAGVDPGRVKTISFGEERPVCSQPSDDCWAKNRRAVTTVRSAEPITLKQDEF